MKKQKKEFRMIKTSIKELRKIIDDMYFELLGEVKGLYKNPKDVMEQGILISIINKTPEQIDTWEFDMGIRKNDK